MTQRKRIFYLACPYSHPDATIKEMRYQLATLMAYLSYAKRNLVYSPLTHDLPINKLELHGNWQTWKELDHEMLSRCNKLLVLRLSGWETSKGAKAEHLHAEKLGPPVEKIDLPEAVYEMYKKIVQGKLRSF